jgi:hypothetical protein
MRKLLCALLLLASCSAPETTPLEQVESPPTNYDNWLGWWPKAQFKDDPAVPAAVWQAARRGYGHVSFPFMESPWTYVSPSFSLLEDGEGLRFDLSWSGPGSMAGGEVWENHPSPQPGEVQVTIVHPDGTVQMPTNGEPRILGWVGGGLGTTGTMIVTFGWLPADLEDYWVRVDFLENRHWFLIPYGFGSDPEAPMNRTPLERGEPTRPKSASESDAVHGWSSVYYDLGALNETECRVNLSISNADHPRLSLVLYRETERWSLHAPRTSVAWIGPGRWVRFGLLESVSRPDSMRRMDGYFFWITPHEFRGWGVLRVTVEEEAVDLAIPSSLFHYLHGRLPQE